MALKVCLIHERITHLGGLETRLFNYMNYFIERGDDVTVVTSKIAPDVVLSEQATIVRIDMSKVMKAIRPAYFDYQLGKLIREKQYDFSLSLDRTSHQKFLIAPNTHLGYLKAKNQTRRGLSDYINIRGDKRAFKHSEVIFACSSMVGDEVEELYGTPKNKIEVLYPPLNTTRFYKDESKSKREWKELCGLDPDKKHILIVSSSNKRKGVPLAIEVMKLLQNENIELVVAGNKGTASKWVNYLGFIKDPSNLYRAANLTIHPAVYEPFGQVVSESIACGTPVLISEKTGAKDIVTDDNGRVLEGYDPEVWAKHIRQMLDAPQQMPDNTKLINNLSLDTHINTMLQFL